MNRALNGAVVGVPADTGVAVDPGCPVGAGIAGTDVDVSDAPGTGVSDGSAWDVAVMAGSGVEVSRVTWKASPPSQALKTNNAAKTTK